jgi:hypothetical protein
LASNKLEEIADMSQLKGAIPERIREGLEKDPVAQTLLKNVISFS